MHTASTRWAALALLAGCNQEYQIGAAVDIALETALECGFTPRSGTQLSRYDCNPVFTGTEERWGEGFQSVGFRTQNVLGHPFYQIWYSSFDAQGNYGLGYASSSDGTTWQAHPGNPVIDDDRGWDATSMDHVRVVWDELAGRYVMAYQGFDVQGGTFGLGVMTSPDGVDWTPFNGGQPVLDLAEPQAETGVSYCWPVGFGWAPDRGYFGYLGGSPPDVPGPAGVGVCQIYDFGAPRLESGFVLGREPVLAAGPEPYDAAGMASAAPFQVNGTWYMFYVGFADWGVSPDNTLVFSQQHSLNLATSPDGRTWTKHPGNPLPVALTDPGVIRQVAAQVVGDQVLLWITDFYEGIGENAVGYYLFEPTGPVHP